MSEEFNYVKIPPFKWFVLENFPFIEADFDALTNWQLFCKLGKEINKIIDSQNIVGEQAEQLTNNYIALYNYVSTFFDNLDLQEEVNNKLDEMAETGQLQDLLTRQYEELTENVNRQIEDFETATNSQINQINTKVNSAVSGAPIPVDSVDDMTNINRIYLLTSSGHWYYYSGSEWIDGGIYQATAIGYESVTPLQTNFFSYEKILNKTTVSDNTRLSSSGGNTSSVQYYATSDFIDVTGISSIYLKGKFDRLRYYNRNQTSINTLIDDTNLEDTEKLIPENEVNPVKYIRIDWDTRVNTTANIDVYSTEGIIQTKPIKEIKDARTINGITYNSLTEALNGSYQALENQITINNSAQMILNWYQQGANNILRIYIPTDFENIYLRQDFSHLINQSVNCDVWRLRRSIVSQRNPITGEFTDITDELIHNASEWECAIKESGKDGFVGGSTHGHEIVTNITFFVDDVEVEDITSMSNTFCNKLRIIRKSNLYRYDDDNVIIGEHYVDYEIANRKIVIDNRINWKVNTTLGISFMTMLGAKRTNNDGQVTSYGIREGNGEKIDISQVDHGYTQNIKKCRKAYAFNDTIAGIKTFMSVELLEDDYLPNSGFHFEDSANYNKFYFDHCGNNYNITNGDIWHTKSEYIIQYLGMIE